MDTTNSPTADLVPTTAAEWQEELNLIIRRGRGLDWTKSPEQFFAQMGLSTGPTLTAWKDIRWYGPLEQFLRDSTRPVSDILINGPGLDIVAVIHGVRHATGVTTHTGWITLLQQILLLQAGMVTPETIDQWPAPADRPQPSHMLIGTIDRKLRYAITRPPATNDGPTISLRILPDRWLSFDDLVTMNVLTREQGVMLLESLRRGASLLIAGVTGSGKTTLAAALLDCIGAEKRIILIEEATELPPTMDSISIEVLRSGRSFAECVYFTLRQKPDLVVVGEARGPEAMALLRAAATGHPGIATIHANNVHTALKNLERMAGEGGDVPPAIVRGTISDENTRLLVIHVGTYGGRRCVGQIVEVRPQGALGDIGAPFTTHTLFAYDEYQQAVVRQGWVMGAWGNREL